MAQYRYRLQTTGENEAAHWTDAPPRTDVITRPWEAAPDGSGALLAIFNGLRDREIVHISAEIGDPAGEGVERIMTPRENATWFIEQPLANAWTDNNGVTTLDEVPDANGIPFPHPAARLDGAALAVFAAGPVNANFEVTHRPRFATERSSHIGVCAYLDTLEGESIADPTTFLRRLERELADAGGRYRLGTNAAGATIYLEGTGYAHGREDGLTFIAPGDVGVQPGQIPPDVASNTAAAYRWHPAVFYTEPATALQRQFRKLGPAPDAADSIDTYPGANVLLEVVEVPVASRWLFAWDGRVQEVVIVHPSGSDLRRPRDVWSTVIVPAINRSQIGGGLVHNRTTTSGITINYEPAGILGDLRRLRWAKFLAPMGATTVAMTGQYIQT